MKIEEILAQPAKVLTRKQREFYFDNGYLLLPEFISAEWLRRLQTVTAAFIDESRTVTASNEKFVLESGRAAAKAPSVAGREHDATYWEFAANSPTSTNTALRVVAAAVATSAGKGAGRSAR